MAKNKTPMTPEQWFHDAFKKLEGQREGLEEDLSRAKKQFPNLVAAFELKDLHERFLESSLVGADDLAYTPIPDTGDDEWRFDLGSFDAEKAFREANIEFEQAQEAANKVVVAGDEEEEVESECDRLAARIARVKDQIHRAPLISMSRYRLTATLARLERFASLLGCGLATRPVPVP